jgi:putative glutamine amidotransferase
MQIWPHIGVPTQTLQAIDGIPDGLPRSWVMNHRYLLTLESVGAVPWLIPLLEDEDVLRQIYDRLDGIFLGGGVDLDPASYGAAREEACGNTDLDRDRVELLLARWAEADGKPVFGVCRGMQILNVVAGGTLIQDFAVSMPHLLKHDYFPTDGHARDYLAHDVALAPDSRLASAFGRTRVMVNSMHHQGVARLGAGLVATAHAADGLIEAVEGLGGEFRVGVQWHPEMLIDSGDGTRRLFEAFIDAARAYRDSTAALL